jgi:hypothetical protein
MLANPRHGADMVRQLLAAELGDALRDTARAHGIMGVPGGWQTLLTPASPLQSLEQVQTVGVEPPEHVEMDRLRRAYRQPQGPVTGRLRWLRAWRRKRDDMASTGTADIA